MANEKHIPEDIILNILSRLPVKSLIRFSSVSKRWRFVILSDPQFARSHMEVACAQKTLSRRRLVNTYPGLESLDLETPLFGDNSSGRKLTFPSNQAGVIVSLLGSCNGLVCVEVVVDVREAWDVINSSTFYIWNPTTGLFQKLPDLVIGAGSERYYGFGYLSATNEYKVMIKNYDQVNIFSTRSHVWKNIESPFHWESLDYSQGLLLNEELYWIPDYGYDNHVHYFEQSIHAFDLAKEEFLEKPLPTDISSHCGEDASFEGWLLGSFEGCLCVCRCDYPWPCNCVVLWVLREYDLCYSWTKLFKLRISDQPAQFPQILIRGSITVVGKLTDQRPRRLMMIDHEEDQCCGPYMLGFIEICSYNVVEYEESLLWLEDYCNSGT